MKSPNYLTFVLVIVVAAFAGCDSNPPPIKKAQLLCQTQMPAGGKTELRIDPSSLSGELKNLSFEWKVSPIVGTLGTPNTVAPSNSYTAAGQSGTVEISVSIKKGNDNVDTASCSIQVVGGGIAATSSPSPSTSPASDRATTDTAIDLDALYYPSNWMGAAELGTKFVRIDRAHEDKPHSSPSCDKWVVQFRNSTDWAAVGWAFPENNWGNQKGRDLSAYSRITLWARGTEGQQLVFKTGGHTKPGAKFSASMPEQMPVVVNLTNEWQQVTIPLRGDKSNIPTALVWVAEARRAGGREMTFFIDDLFLEK